MLELRNLSIVESGREIVKNSTWTIERGKITALIGESGSGKSLTVLALVGMLPKKMQVSGEILFRQQEILKMSNPELKQFRREGVFTIFQDAMSSFNPSIHMGKQLYALSGSQSHETYASFLEKIPVILQDLSLSIDVLTKYPFELSGGMLQRCMIACAIYKSPSLLIADEPTSALDSTNQQELLSILKSMNDKYGTTILFITHDIDVVKEIADDLVVMLKGEIVEKGSAKTLLLEPNHEYTKRLLTSSFR